MSNAAKHRKKAAEFEQLKQFDRAIASYIKAIEESEAEGADIDVALLNKVGDLTLRQGRVPEAVTYYERAVEHYATSGLFNNAIALCNKILRSAPGRSNVYFTLGRICAKKGLRGDATRNFLEYATRMRQDGRVDEGMRALAEVADLMPELTEVRRLVEEHADRAGIVLPRRKTPLDSPAIAPSANEFRSRDAKSNELIFLDIGDAGSVRRNTPPLAPRVRTPVASKSQTPASAKSATLIGPASLDAFLLFDPSKPGATATPLATPVVEPVPDLLTDHVELTPADVAPEVVDGRELALEATADIASVDGASPVDSVVEALPVEVFAATVSDALEVTSTNEIDESTAAIEEPAVSGLEQLPEIADVPVQLVEGLTSDEELDPVDDSEARDPALTWVVPVDAVESLDEPSGLEPHGELHTEDEAPVDVLSGLVIEDFDSVADSEDAVMVTGTRAGTPTYSSVVARELTPLEVSPIPELEAAIEAGALAAARAESDPELVAKRPPFRLDPHDFILPGELPPLTVDDELVDAGLAAALQASAIDESAFDATAFEVADLNLAAFEATLIAHAADDSPELADDVVDLSAVDRVDAMDDQHAMLASGPATTEEGHGGADVIAAEVVEATNVEATNVEADIEADIEPDTEAADVDEAVPDANIVEPAEEFGLEADSDVGAEEALRALIEGDATSHEPLAESIGEIDAPGAPDAPPGITSYVTSESSDEATQSASDVSVEDTQSDYSVNDYGSTSNVISESENVAEPEPVPTSRAISSTPALPIAAVATEANAVATSRRDELRQAVVRDPQDWVLRRRLAEALFEAGEREAGLAELQAALTGFAHLGHFGAAADIADELVRTSPERVPYHQKRVELAVRLNDQGRLRLAYLDLADMLVRLGDEVRAHAVYARVLEIDPWDDRARTALGSAAPPAPPKPQADDQYVSLADWLRDEGAPDSTRMRMRAPAVSGDEQADFDALLQHFKDGVARSLGEEDYESHYDLGVAYKEMGLLDDAIAEFQKALRSRRHRLPAYEALGQCFVEQSRHSVAATVLTRALHEPDMGDEHRIGVLYLLAYSCEALQRWDEARSYYSRVYATDINFRDVAARLAALDQIAR